MNWRQKGSICFLGMIWMLVLGMCFERIGTDSLLSYDFSRFVQEDAAQEMVLGNVEGSPLCEQTYLKDTFGTQEMAAVIRHAARKGADRSYNRTGDGCLWGPVQVWAGFPDKGYQALCAGWSVPGIQIHIIIVSYIHQKDGKKA